MKLLKVLVAAIVLAAMVTPAVAEDRFSLGGSMQVRGFYKAGETNGVDLDDRAYNDMRLRIQGTIAVAEGVKVVFRNDIGEATDANADSYVGQQFGSMGQNTMRFGSDLHWDKIYLELAKNGYTFRAGQQYYRSGMIGTLGDHLGTGFYLANGPFTIWHTKMDEETLANSDRSLTGAQFNFGADAFKGSVFGTFDKGLMNNDELYALGLSFNTDLGAFAVKGELNLFDGENAGGGDEEGLQLYLDASTSASDTLTVGGMFLYAQAQDSSDQITRVAGTGFGGFAPQTYGFFHTDFEYFDIFDPSGADQGVVAAQLYSNVALSDDLDGRFAAMFYTVEDDFAFDADGIVLNANVSYALMANTKLNAGVNYRTMDAGADSDLLQLATGLYVSF